MRKPLIIMSIFIGLTGCGDYSVKESEPVLPEMEPVVAAVTAKEEAYSLYYEARQYTLSLYEPEEGCYLGAYILSNKKINFEIDRFEELTQKEHAVYQYHMKLDDFFPSTWVLSCIAKLKTPYIVVKPADDQNPFDKEIVDRAASAFGEFYVPMFVEFYPDPRAKGYDPEAYVEFFRYARQVFKEKASNVAFVWAVDAENNVDCQSYYPGDAYTDWVGLHLYEKIRTEAETRDIRDRIDSFYYRFQKTKPVMLSQLAVSHYSSVNHVYVTGRAAEAIKSIYADIQTRYPRIKLVNYMDFNAFEIGVVQAEKDNYSITDEDELLRAYRSAVGSEAFLSETDVSSTGDTVAQLMLSPFTVYQLDEGFFAPENVFTYDLSMKGLSNEKMLHGLPHFNLDIMEKNKLRSMEVDEEKKQVILR